MKKCMGCMNEIHDNQNSCPYCGYLAGTGPQEVYHMVPGSVLSGRYIVGKTVGYGGFGVTYVGYDMELQRKVAIKEYLPGEFSTRVPGQTQVTVYGGEKQEQFQSGIEKFIDEARRLAKFDDIEGVVHIYDSFLSNGTAYIVMEYIDGITLKEKIQRDGKLSLEDTMHIILPIISALKAIHKEGIIHRDIAPDNIMIDKNGKASLIDFGASRFATTTHSKSLSVLIKAGYAPMEQYQSRGQQGPWSDVYSLAATMYTMLTGIVPQESIERGGQDLVKAPSKVGVKISRNLDTAIMNAMNVKVEERTPSMERFEEELLSQKDVARLSVKKDKEDTGKWPVWLKVVLGGAVAMVATFLVLLVTGVISIEGLEWGEASVTKVVPNFRNVTTEKAADIAAKRDIEIQIIGREYSEELKKGVVLTQSVAPGTELIENMFVELTVSAGEKTVFMPSITGIEKGEAIKRLEEMELTWKIIEISSAVTEGYVVSQSIEPDEEVVVGTEIILQVSKGLSYVDESIEVEMPDLANMEFDQAVAVMSELGLSVAKSAEQYDANVLRNRIIKQDVKAGEILHQGDTVMVVVSLGNSVKVPDVELLEKQAAIDALTEAQLKYKIQEMYSDTVKAGVVISQSVADGTNVNIGTQIVLNVSVGKENSGNTGNTGTGVAGTGQTKGSTTAPSDTGTGGVNADSGQTGTTTGNNTQKAAETWSDWVETLPAGVSNANYDIETKTQYSSRTKMTLDTPDTSPAGQGYSLDGTDYGDWSAPSDWSTTDPGESDLLQRESQLRYSYRDKSTTESTNSSLDGWTMSGSRTEWGGWSGWQDGAVSASSTRNVQTQQVDDPNSPIYSVTKYKYSKWYILGSDNQYHTGPTQGSISGWGWNSTYQEEYSATQKTYVGQSGAGVPMYEGSWYNEEAIWELTGYNKKTQYRYQDLITYYQYYRWSDWSGYSTDAVNASDTREVRTATYYRYRTRTITYHYSKWGEWSTYSDTPVSSSSTVDVQTRTLYRYKKK